MIVTTNIQTAAWGAIDRNGSIYTHIPATAGTPAQVNYSGPTTQRRAFFDFAAPAVPNTVVSRATLTVSIGSTTSVRVALRTVLLNHTFANVAGDSDNIARLYNSLTTLGEFAPGAGFTDRDVDGPSGTWTSPDFAAESLAVFQNRLRSGTPICIGGVRITLAGSRTFGYSAGAVLSITHTRPPLKVINISPENGAIDQPRDGVTLVCEYPGGPPPGTAFDFYMGISPSALMPLALAQPNPTTTTSILEPGQRYYWRCDSRDADGTTIGDVWWFRTAGSPVEFIVERVIVRSPQLQAQECADADFVVDSAAQLPYQLRFQPGPGAAWVNDFYMTRARQQWRLVPETDFVFRGPAADEDDVVYLPDQYVRAAGGAGHKYGILRCTDRSTDCYLMVAFRAASGSPVFGLALGCHDWRDRFLAIVLDSKTKRIRYGRHRRTLGAHSFTMPLGGQSLPADFDWAAWHRLLVHAAPHEGGGAIISAWLDPASGAAGPYHKEVIVPGSPYYVLNTSGFIDGPPGFYAAGGEVFFAEYVVSSVESPLTFLNKTPWLS